MRPLLIVLAVTYLSSGQEYEYQITKVNLATLSSTSFDSSVDIARIMGGSATDIALYPYAVQLIQSGQLICGGTLVTGRHVLTAAHCVVDLAGQTYDPTTVTVRAGTTYLNSGGSTRQLSAIIPHQHYDCTTLDSDIALLVLASAFTLSASIQPAALPVMTGSLPIFTPVVHVGWGRTAEGGELASALQQVLVYKVNHTLCAQRYWYLSQVEYMQHVVTDNNVCAGILGVGGADACRGDSGGPLVLASNRSVLVGVTSWGYSCGHPDLPGVSVRVSGFTDWIDQTVRRYNSAPSLALSSALLFAALFASSNLYEDV